MQAFFDYVRAKLFGGTLSQPQVDGINALLTEWAASGDGDKRKLAYILATAKHETANTIQPIEEYGHGAGHPYGLPTGPWHQVYDGRGDAQLTFESNYIKATTRLHALGRFLDVDLDKTPALAMRQDIAAAVIVVGMLEGWFTGKKLSDYIGASCDFINSRRVVNGTDRAVLIAGYATEFLNGLNKVDAPHVPNMTPPQPFPPLPRPVPLPTPQPQPMGFWQALLAFLISLFNKRI